MLQRHRKSEAQLDGFAQEVLDTASMIQGDIQDDTIETEEPDEHSGEHSGHNSEALSEYAPPGDPVGVPVQSEHRQPVVTGTTRNATGRPANSRFIDGAMNTTHLNASDFINKR